MNPIFETLILVVPIAFVILFFSKGIAKKMDEKGMWD